MENPYQITQEVHDKYFKGFRNRMIRVYFYLREGLYLINDFKYLIAGIMGVYVVLKFDDALVMIVMFIVSIPLLIIAGYFWVHKAKKSLEWFGVEYTTHFSKYNIELAEKQIRLLEEISTKLNERK